MCTLLSHIGSAWRHVYKSGCNQALMTMTGFDFKTFHFINEKFKCFFNNLSSYSSNWMIIALQQNNSVRTGCKRLIFSVDGLGLVLTWTRTHGSNMVLQLIFYMNKCFITLDFLLWNPNTCIAGHW